MSYLGNNIQYFRINNAHANLDVVRIAPGANPFVITSSVGPDANLHGSPPKKSDGSFDLPTVKTRAPRLIKKSHASTPVLESGNLRQPYIDATYKGKTSRLIPMWVSNGTFFLTPKDAQGQTDYSLPSYLGGPVRDSYGQQVDTAYKIRSGKAGKRWYYSQPEVHIFDTHSFTQANAGTSAFALASSHYSLFGGAGPLIRNGKPQTHDDWTQEGFKPAQWYDAGPVVASNDEPEATRVHYLIMDRTVRQANEHGWEIMVDYLSNHFVNDLATLGVVGDGFISNAIVFDAGGSKSLWVPGHVAPRGARPVPHFLWLYGQR